MDLVERAFEDALRAHDDDHDRLCKLRRAIPAFGDALKRTNLEYCSCFVLKYAKELRVLMDTCKVSSCKKGESCIHSKNDRRKSVTAVSRAAAS